MIKKFSSIVAALAVITGVFVVLQSNPFHVDVAYAVCGDGAIDGGDECDDGGTTPGDGCDDSCLIETGYICEGSPSVCIITVPQTTTSVSNVSPAFSVPPSDSGSADGTGVGSTAGNPTNKGDNITFTATAWDVNGDDYYLLICPTNGEPTHNGAGTNPSCAAGSEWANTADAESEASGTGESLTYEAGSDGTNEGTYCTSGSGTDNDELCPWYAFACDDVAAGTCWPIAANHGADTDALVGDQGFGSDYITFTDIPDDEDVVTIQSLTYEFDTTDGATCATTPDTCIDISDVTDATTAAAALAAATVGDDADSWAVSRGTIFYVYSDVAGTDTTAAVTTNVCSCMTATDGDSSANNASPFAVNHAPIYDLETGVTIDASDGSTIAPGDTVRFTLASANWDEDDNADGTQDQVIMVVCSGESEMGGGETTAFVPTNTGSDMCTGGTLICESSDTSPGSDLTCNDAGDDLVSVPTAHDSYNVVIYIKDVHDMAGDLTDIIGSDGYGTNVQTDGLVVIDVPPVIDGAYGTTPGTGYQVADDDLTESGGGNPIVAGDQGGYSFVWSVGFTDDNGDADVTAVEGVFFDDSSSGVGNAGEGTTACVSTVAEGGEKNCYINTTCTRAGHESSTGADKTATGSDKYLTADCSVTIYFNAQASTGWEVQGKPTDGLGQVTGLAKTTTGIELETLEGIELVQTAIAYSTVAIGGTSTVQGSCTAASGSCTSMGNVGNDEIDVYVEGDDMCITSYASYCSDGTTSCTIDANCETIGDEICSHCSGASIPLAQQKWHNDTADFVYDTDEATAGAWTLGPVSSGNAETGGCINRDIAIRDDHTSTTETNEGIHWKLRIPSDQSAGSYFGQNTFTAAADTTCSGGAEY